MSAVTLEDIQAKQTELAKLIAQFQQPTPATTYIEVEDITIELQPDERYAGTVLDEDGELLHHLVLMAQQPGKKLNWQAAMEWATSVGAALPTRQEQSLLFANCKPHLKAEWHWSSETHADDASYAWYCYFVYGDITGNLKSYEGCAVAVRRV